MRKNVGVVLIGLALALGGCATVAPSMEGKGVTTTREVRERDYIIGVERSVVVGNSIVRVRDYLESVTETPSMVASQDFQLSGGPVTMRFRQGEQLAIIGERVVDGRNYTVAAKDNAFGIQIADDGTIAPGVLNNVNVAPVVMVYQFQPNPAGARFTRATDRQVSRSPRGQNFEIVFNGIDGQAMRFQYREYTAEDMARPAFYQELSYPLNTRTVRFRDIVIQVAAVDAQQIRFTVTADGAVG